MGTMRKITMLGTGNAMVTKCYNTCFYVTLDDGSIFLTDAGGGNGILRQFECTDFDYGRCHHMFVTHGHTDHVLGVIWVLRKVADLMNKGLYVGKFHVYGHDVVIDIVRQMTKLTLKQKDFARIDTDIILHEMKDGETAVFSDVKLAAFDILSTKAKQFGYELTFSDGYRITCLGDEPFNEHDRKYAEGADVLMAEAFCKCGDRDTFHPYEKNHTTVKEASEFAESLDVKRLILYHTEDETLATRKRDYTNEAQQYFHRKVYVPDDLETISLEA